MKFQPNELLSKGLLFEKGFSAVTSSEKETRSLGKDLVSLLPEKVVLLFSGDLGAGKTTYIKGMAEALELDPFLVTSPTFSLLHIYNTDKRQLYHFDLYRLEDKEEFTRLGFEELLQGSGIFCIEWPERLSSFTFNCPTLWIDIKYRSLEERTITVTPHL